MAGKNKNEKWIKTDSSRVMLLRGASEDLEFEKVAARAYAVMLNTRDPLAFVPLLAENVQYSSQNVLADMNGRKEVAKYLAGKMANIEKNLSAHVVFAELGEWQGRPCVVVAQAEKEPPVAVVIFSVKKKAVLTVAMCTVVPNPDMVQRSEIYPETL